jgi:hypothetical protein
MVGVAVRSFRPEGHHNLRPNAPDVRDNLPDRLGGVCLIEVVVEVGEKLDISNAQHLRSRQEFGGAKLAERLRPRIGAWITLPATLATCCGDQGKFDARRSILGQRAASTQGLIVRVGEDTQQSFGFSHLTPPRVILLHPQAIHPANRMLFIRSLAKWHNVTAASQHVQALLDQPLAKR